MAPTLNNVRQESENASSVLYFGGTRVDALFQQRVSVSFLFRLEMHLKRLFDIVLSCTLIGLCLPIFLFALIAVRLSSRGPFIFSQLRWGQNEQPFRCYKIRTMYVDQSARFVSEQPKDESNKGILLKMKNDPRVTRVGAFLRRTSIDELPQLFNVLRGDMSIVGPRPLVLHMMDPYPEIRAVRCVARPGLTGLWQTRNRANNTSVMHMIADDIDYIVNLCLLLDFKILMVTPWELLRGSGAH